MGSAGGLGGRVALGLGAILVLVFVARVGWVAHLWSEDPSATLYPDTVTYVRPAALERHGAFTVGPHTDEAGIPHSRLPRVHRRGVLRRRRARARGAHGPDRAERARDLDRVRGRAPVRGPAEGLVAASILALDPLQFWASGTLLSESLMGFLLLLAVALGFRVFAPRRIGIVWPLLLGLTLAVATLVRPVTYYLLVVASCVRGPGRTTAQRGPAVAGVAFLVPVVLLVGGWQVRNEREVGSWRLASVEAVNMRFYRAAAIVADREGIDLVTVQDRFRRENGPEPADATTARTSTRCTTAASRS